MYQRIEKARYRKFSNIEPVSGFFSITSVSRPCSDPQPCLILLVAYFMSTKFSCAGADSDKPKQPSFKLTLRNSKWCSVCSLTLIEYSSDKQRLWQDCAYAQADLKLFWSHIPHCWKSHVAIHFFLRFFSSSSVLLEDTFGYDKTTASNINGVLYDTALILCPISGHIYVGITLMSNLYI